MNLRRLQYFINVVDCGTVTAAAEKLHIAQPALSRQLKTLERELRLELFETRGNRLMLTSSGRAFVPMARKLIVQARDLTKSVEVLRTGMVHRLSCAATAASLRGFLAHFIANLGPDEPTIVAREAGHFGLEYELDDDLDFIITPTVPSGDLASVMLGDVALRAQVPDEHPWHREQRPAISLEEVSRQSLILPPQHTVSRRILDEAMDRMDLRYGSYEECEDGFVSHALVAAGRGVGISTEYPAFGVRGIPIIENLTLPGTKPLSLRMYLAWHRSHYAEDKIRELAGRLSALVVSRQQYSEGSSESTT